MKRNTSVVPVSGETKASSSSVSTSAATSNRAARHTPLYSPSLAHTFPKWRVNSLLPSFGLKRPKWGRLDRRALSGRLARRSCCALFWLAFLAYVLLVLGFALVYMVAWRISGEIAWVSGPLQDLYFSNACILAFQGAGLVDSGAVLKPTASVLAWLLCLERMASAALFLGFALVIFGPHACSTAAVYSPHLVLHRAVGGVMALQFRVAHPGGHFILDPHIQCSVYFRDLRVHDVGRGGDAENDGGGDGGDGAGSGSGSGRSAPGLEVQEANLPVRMHSVMTPEQVVTHFVTDDSPLSPLTQDAFGARIQSTEHLVELVSHFGVFITGTDAATMEKVVSYKMWSSADLKLGHTFVPATATESGDLRSHPFQEGRSSIDMLNFARTEVKGGWGGKSASGNVDVAASVAVTSTAPSGGDGARFSSTEP